MVQSRHYVKILHFSIIHCISLIFLFQYGFSLKIFKPKDNMITLQLSPKHSDYYYDLSLLSLQSNHFLSGDNHKEATKLFKQELSRKLTEYSGIVQIGNPPQSFEMVFDTGSANILITSSYCNSIGCANHKKYNPELSTTNNQILRLDSYYPDIIKSTDRDTVIINFGTGQVKCYLAKDDVCISNDSLCSNQHVILEAYDESTNPFSHVKFDGIIGLSFTYLSVNPQSNFIEMLYQQKKINKRIFSFYFNIDDHKKSILNIGGYNSEYYTGDILYAKVNSRNYWEIDIEGIYYGDNVLINCVERSCTGVVDTGTSMIAAPLEAFNLLKAVTKVEFHCNGLESMRNLAFKINGVMYQLEPQYYVLQIETPSKGKNCFNAVMQLDALSTPFKQTFILGLPFFKKYYTVFDRENKRIGFALAKHDTQLTNQK